VRQAEQQQRVGAGTDEVVLVGVLRGAAAARVDHDDLAAALADPPEPAAHVWRGHQAAVRRERVGPQHQQVVGAVHVRHRHREPGAEHQPRRDLLGHLVDGARGVDVLRAERLHQHAPVEHVAEAVRARVADVGGDRVAAVLLEQRHQAAVDLLERLVPGRLHELAVAADERRGQAVGVLVERPQARALGADEALREDVGVVAADRLDRVPVEAQLEPAGGLTERARRICGALSHAHVEPTAPRRADARPRRE
jgi:hypothetical protein